MKNGPYELIVPPEEYPGKLYRDRYAYEHHVVWWENTGELLQEGEVIHHINHKKRDNRFENLELMRVEDHSRQHAPEKTFETLKCAFCGVIFRRDVRHVRTKRRQGQTNFFCCRKHVHEYLKTT